MGRWKSAAFIRYIRIRMLQMNKLWSIVCRNMPMSALSYNFLSLEWLIPHVHNQVVAVCSECCSMTGIHHIHHCAYLGNGAQFSLVRNGWFCFYIVSGRWCVQWMLPYDWHSSYASICLFVQYCAIFVSACIECYSMTGIHCIHQLSICLYLLECLILPFYLAINVGGGCCSMTGIHRMQDNTWEHDWLSPWHLLHNDWSILFGCCVGWLLQYDWQWYPYYSVSGTVNTSGRLLCNHTNHVVKHIYVLLRSEWRSLPFSLSVCIA